MKEPLIDSQLAKKLIERFPTERSIENMTAPVMKNEKRQKKYF